MKKQYNKPSMEAVEINQRQQLLAGSVKSLNTDVGLDYVGGSSEPARAPLLGEDW